METLKTIGIVWIALGFCGGVAWGARSYVAGDALLRIAIGVMGGPFTLAIVLAEISAGHS